MENAARAGIYGGQERGNASGVEHDTAEREMCLLTATKMPAGHQKLIRGKISHQPDEKLLLFTPSITEEIYCCLTVWWRKKTTNS